MVGHYDVYDGDEKVLENVTRKEIEEFFGETLPTGLTSYIIEKWRFKGRYLITYTSVSQESKDPFIKEWEDAVRPFKNVIWVKSGGRRLRVGG